MADPLAEHIEYLSLSGRYEKYQAAIDEVVRPGDVVADLGCGFGVLGLQCLKAGAARVYGIDHSDAIEIARETVSRAGLADRYTCLRGSTFRVTLQEKVDVLICDHIGYFGFDYGIIAMLGDARRRFLKEGGRIIPRKMQLFLAGAESASGRDKAEAWGRPPIPEELHWLREYGVNSRHPLSISPDALCTETAAGPIVDFHHEAPENLAFAVRLTASRTCRVDGLVGWFACELAPQVLLSNSPLSHDSIARPQAFLPLQEPVDLEKGQALDVRIRVLLDPVTVNWTVEQESTGSRQRMSTWKSRVLAEADLPGSEAELNLKPIGESRKLLLELVDGNRSAQAVEEEFLRASTGMFPTEAEAKRFVQRELRLHAE